MSYFSKVRVGSITLHKPLEVTQHYECAAWFQTVEAQPGTYDLFAYTVNGREVHAGRFTATVTGPVKDACFRARLGAHVSRTDPERDRLLGTTQEGFVEVSAFGDVGEIWPRQDGITVMMDDSVVERIERVLEYKRYNPELKESVMGKWPSWRYVLRKTQK